MWALQLKGNDRPQSVTEFLEALETKPVAATAAAPILPWLLPLLPPTSNHPVVRQGALRKLAAHIIRAIKRVMLDFWLYFLEILPRLLLLAAIVFGLWWFFMRKPNQLYSPSKPSAKSKSTSSKKHP